MENRTVCNFDGIALRIVLKFCFEFLVLFFSVVFDSKILLSFSLNTERERKREREGGVCMCGEGTWIRPK